MGRLLDWKLGEQFFLFIEDDIDSTVYVREQKNLGWLSKNGELKLLINGSRYSFACESGDFSDYHHGDIGFVEDSGLLRKAYESGSNEIDLFITNKCNSNCIMCPLPEAVRKQQVEKHLDWIKGYIDYLPENIKHINVTGGEPTLAKEGFLEVMNLLKNKFVRTDFQILTNGRSFADSNFMKRVLEVCPTGVKFAIPIHAANSLVHDSITRADGSFSQTDKGIRNLLRERQIVEIRVVVSQKNISVLDEIAVYIANNYQNAFCVNYIGMEMMGNAALYRKELWVDYEDVFSAAKYGIDYLVRSGIDVQLYNFPLCDVDKGYWHIAAKSITDYKVRYMDECGKCAVKEMCGGFFQSTKQVMQPKVHPVKE